MQVILIEDVKDLGRKGDIVNVRDGYAKNMLLPKKLAVEATDKNLKMIKSQKDAAEHRAERQKAQAMELAEKLEKEPIHLGVRMGSAGRAFGSVSTKDIAEGIQKELGVEIDKKKIVTEGTIKESGEYTVTVKLHPEVSARVRILVEPV